MRKLICILLLGSFVNLFAQTKSPNIIVIMADDMGFADVGFTGAKDINTPNIDKLAASGVVFKNGYITHPFCAPSRAGLLAGRYQHRFGFEHNPPSDSANPIVGIDVNEKLFPKRLQEVGYTTGIIGKWHLGSASPYNPNNRGFDYFYGFLNGGHDYYKIDVTKPIETGYNQGLVRNKQVANFEGYLTTALSNDAVKFVEDNKEKSFFLFLSYNAPHQPLQAPKEDIARYAHIKNKKRRVYAAMVDVMDRGIGNVVSALENHDLRENTLIFFLSDNGGPVPSKHSPNKGNGSSNAPFRGGKTDYYEGGVHVPFIASWPAKIESGQVYNQPVISLDISRTAVEVAGGNATSGNKMEGVNLIPYLNGKRSDAPHDALYWRFLSTKSIISGGYKYIQKGKSNPELFNLEKDIEEQNDILDKNPELATKMLKLWGKWDANNVEMRNPVYSEYYRSRDAFFENMIPDGAKKEGYKPEFKKMFPKN
ncbi:sulfatase-like hydrolase/transferase [Lutibacter citreus]|uniref:sulfatase-like hydrolase/transferase n=1 Tax=Lutibacter citreus TaxID=2138210 RepID=UPI000DBE12A7|nr:sulfatase-like hydrolase/transferase [Lutibacter citreus]